MVKSTPYGESSYKRQSAGILIMAAREDTAGVAAGPPKT